MLQGFGVAAATVVAMAVLRDLFSGTMFARLLSRLLLVMGAAPVLAPTLGGWLLEWTRWPGCLRGAGRMRRAAGRVAALGAARDPATAPRRPARRCRPIVAHLRSLLRDRTFVGLAAVAALTFGALFAYVSGSSFVLQEQYGLDEQQFGLAFGAGRDRPDRGHPVQPVAAAPLPAPAHPRRRTEHRRAVRAGAAGVRRDGFGGLPALLVALWVVLAPPGWRCRTPRRWRCPGTARRPAPRPPCSVPRSSAPVRSPRRVVGVLGNDASGDGHGDRCQPHHAP